MIVLIKYDNKIKVRWFKHKFIGYWLCVMINKLKGYQVEVLEDDGI